jgi:diguanylate cyclase (GGDEF)-like protein
MSDRLVEKDILIENVNRLISKGEGPFSIAVVDIDNFDSINKTYSNESGDEVINKLSSILEQNITDIDLISKSGDEFTILLVSKGAERSFMEMEEIRKYLSDNTFTFPNSNKLHEIDITISCGIASYPRDAKNAVNLFRIADSAMFRAKKLGKNKVCLSEIESMVLKSSYFTKTQLDRLAALAKEHEKTEAFLLREALDDLFKKYPH